MRKSALIFVVIMIYSSQIFAQGKDKANAGDWSINAEAGFYFIDPFFVLPVISVEKNLIHLEARYNYEDLKTFSGWLGYNFSGGSDFTYSIVPMGGIIAGRITGLAPGLELTLGFSDFEFYSESEYVFDTENKENNYFYNWVDFSYSPAEWLSFGLSFERTKTYETNLDTQSGVFAGVGYKNYEMTIYYFNPGHEEEFVMMSVSGGF